MFQAPLRSVLVILALPLLASSHALAFGSRQTPDTDAAPTPNVTMSPSPITQGQPYDSLILAISYQNEFCQFKPSAVECKTAAAHMGLSLHGLWPDRQDDPQNKFQYCGYDQNPLEGLSWCDENFDVKSKMTGPTFSYLSTVMPGVSSCLYNHEWYAHGTCSGMSVDTYFDQAQVLASRFIHLKALPQLLADAAGGTVDREEILNALQADLGPKALAAIKVNCNKKNKVAFFSEVQISLNPDHALDFPAESSLSRVKPNRKKDGTLVPDLGSCPRTEITIVE